MPVCPSCNLPSADPDALFCAHCGFALPDRPAGVVESFSATASSGPPAPPTRGDRAWQAPAWASQPDPRAVAVGLGALAAAVVLAISLSYAPGSTPAGHAVRVTAPPRPGRDVASVRRGPPPVALERYRSADYSFAYPSGWRVARSDRPVSSFRETALERLDGMARVTVDYSPGESTDPAAKASQVEAATSITPGYRRLSFQPTSVHGHAAFAWEFTVADANPRRADLFVRARGGGFAVLADGSDLAGARAAARLIAGSLNGMR